MTNLKDKLAASLRQAKAGEQAPGKPIAKAITKPQRKPSPASAVKGQATEPKGHRPIPTPEVNTVNAAGFGFPERIWPD